MIPDHRDVPTALLRILTLLLVSAAVLTAAPLNVSVGLIAFDALGSENAFTLYNMSGPFSSVDFPVSDSVPLEDAELHLLSDSGVWQTIVLGTLAPGSFTSSQLTFPAGAVFTAGTFKADVPSEFTLSNGDKFTPDSTMLFLAFTPDTSLPEVVSIAGQTAETVIPEPFTGGFVVVGLLAIAGAKRVVSNRRRLS